MTTTTITTTTDTSKRRAFRGVTYSQFDNKLGPKLLFSYPADVISNELFESLSDFTIVGKHFCDKTITVKYGDIQFINYSVAIENPKYVRNTIMFSFGIILDIDTESEPYENLLRKVSETFQTLEVRRFVFIFQYKHTFSNNSLTYNQTIIEYYSWNLSFYFNLKPENYYIPSFVYYTHKSSNLEKYLLKSMQATLSLPNYFLCHKNRC